MGNMPPNDLEGGYYNSDYFRDKEIKAQRNEIIHPRDLNLSNLTPESALSTMT